MYALVSKKDGTVQHLALTEALQWIEELLNVVSMTCDGSEERGVKHLCSSFPCGNNVKYWC